MKNAQTPAELAANAGRESQQFKNARTSSYIDTATGAATRAFATPLKLEPRLGVQLPAWDVYLAYDAGTRWSASGQPAPAYWMHQLSNAPPDRKLDADKFRDAVERLLNTNAEAAASGHQ